MPRLNYILKPETLASAIASIQENNPNITCLNLNHKNLTYADMIPLCAALAKNTTLTTLVLGHNRIGNRGAEALAKNTTLTSSADI